MLATLASTHQGETGYSEWCSQRFDQQRGGVPDAKQRERPLLALSLDSLEVGRKIFLVLGLGFRLRR